MGKLAGKIAVITGGTSGIGLASAKLFKAEGATIITHARHEARKAETLANHEGLFDYVGVADAGKVSEVDAFFKEVGEKYGKIDVLFLNAGFGKPSPIEYVTEDFFDSQFAVNVKGLFFSIKSALPYLGKGASVVLNTSIANQLGMTNFSVYAATKAAVRSLARTLSAELVGRGIRVNAVSPGPIETPFLVNAGFSNEQIEAMTGFILSQTPIGRFGQPEEVAKAALFLASDDSSFILGEELVIDGGMATL